MTAYFLDYQQTLPTMAKHCNLKNSTSFNRIMAEHYETLYNSYRRTWHFRKALFAWYRMKLYRERAHRCRVQHLLNEANKKHHVSIILQ